MKKKLKLRQAKLSARLWGDVEGPIRGESLADLRTQLATLTSQRDDALRQLNRRANILKTAEVLDTQLAALEKAVERMSKILRAFKGIMEIDI